MILPENDLYLQVFGKVAPSRRPLFLFYTHLIMTEQQIISILEPLVEKACEPFQAFKVSVSVKKGSQTEVEVSVQTRTGLTSGEATGISRSLNDLLESVDLFDGPWDLVVGSPGIGEPLRDFRALESQISRLVEVTFRADTGKKPVTGYLRSVSDAELIIEEKNKHKKEEPPRHALKTGEIEFVTVQVDW